MSDNLISSGKNALDYKFEEYCQAIRQFAMCMEDYLYLYDIPNDRYYISPKAVERFAMPHNYFSNVTETLRQFVYAEDFDMLQKDLGQVAAGEKDEHNIEYRWIGKDGEPIWINCRGRAIRDEDGNTIYMYGCVNEIGKKRKADNISGLREVSASLDVIEKFCSAAKGGYLLHLGLDDFRSINERFGHQYGDYILKGVAECVVNALGIGEEVYHVSADEFLVVSYLSDDVADGKALYNSIRANMDKFIEKNSYKSVFTISAGLLSSKKLRGMENENVLKLSGFALSQAKKLGKNRLYSFKKTDYNNFLRSRIVLSTMRESISADFEGFEVYFQPIVKDDNTKKPYAAEALLRYRMPDGEKISPVEFIPLLEESGLIIPIGKWVLKKAITFCQRVQEYIPDFSVNVNVSYVQVLKSSFIVEFFHLLDEHKMAPSNITIELTESGELDHSGQLHNIWNHLRGGGVTIALDDFGTGYSNLMNISDIAPSVVKLDRGFTEKALKLEFEKRLMESIIQLVHSLGLKICIEGVETEEELKDIRTLKPDFMQGFYFGRPCPEDAFIREFVEE
ncbi:MAG: GGDEF and EAL domain-containing protein [Agathobacter sp.]|nr:GGDEF and EAL domain-containing protein [Agathobacter sp.]